MMSAEEEAEFRKEMQLNEDKFYGTLGGLHMAYAAMVAYYKGNFSREMFKRFIDKTYKVIERVDKEAAELYKEEQESL